MTGEPRPVRRRLVLAVCAVGGSMLNPVAMSIIVSVFTDRRERARAVGGFLLLNTLYLQDVRHYSALRAGLMLIPLAVAQGVLANISGRLVASRGARLPLVLGGALLAAGGLDSQQDLGFPLQLVGLLMICSAR